MSTSKLVFHNLSSSEIEIEEDSITQEFWVESKDELNQETICGIDERKKVIATQQMPFKAICKLYMKAPNGRNYVGSGWLINNDTLLTAGHCVFNRKSGGWKTRIIVIPGKSGLSEPYGRYNAISLMATEDWIENGSFRFDMGAIKLDAPVSHDMYLNASIEDSPIGLICGYPADRDNGLFQYQMKDNLLKGQGRFEYFADTFGGQSGCPILKNRTTAIGIHNYGGCPNKASDLYEDFITGAINWNEL